MSPSNIVTIAVDEPGLSLQAAEGGSQYRLVAESPTTFYISRDESYVFSDDRFTISFGDTKIVAKKLSP